MALGAPFAWRWRVEGADIALNYVSNAEAAEQTQRDIEALGARVRHVGLISAIPDAVDAMVKDVGQALGPIDLLVTAAGIAHFGDHSKVDFDLWQRNYEGQCRWHLPANHGCEGRDDRPRLWPNRLASPRLLVWRREGKCCLTAPRKQR